MVTYKQSDAHQLFANKSFFRYSCDAINRSLEQYECRWLFLLIAVLLACSVANDLHLKLWLDELLTFHMAQQGSSTAIVKATMDGSDGAPPLYAMIVAVTSTTISNQALALRLPSTLGY